MTLTLFAQAVSANRCGRTVATCGISAALFKLVAYPVAQLRLPVGRASIPVQVQKYGRGNKGENLLTSLVSVHMPAMMENRTLDDLLR